MKLKAYFSQVAVLLFGNVLAQLVNLASYPLLTRIYSPADFGGFALFVAVVSVIGPVACARLDIVVQSGKDWQMPAAIRQALRFNAAAAAASAAVTILASLLTAAIPAYMGLLVGLAVFLSGYTLALLALFVRQERYPLYARTLVVRALITAVAQLLLWLVLPGDVALILGFCIGFAAQAIALGRPFRKELLRRPAPSHYRAIRARFSRQLFTDIPNSLLTSLMLNVMSILLLFLYSKEAVGYYSLAYRVGVLPVVLISDSLSQVFFQKAAAAFRETGGFWIQVRLNILVSALLSVAVFVPIAAFARPVFAIVFGPEWIMSADLLIASLPLLVARFVSSTVQTAPLVIGRPGLLVGQNMGVLAAVSIGSLLAIALRFGAWNFVFVSSCLMALAYIAYVAFVAVVVRTRYSGKPSFIRSTRVTQDQ